MEQQQLKIISMLAFIYIYFIVYISQFHSLVLEHESKGAQNSDLTTKKKKKEEGHNTGLNLFCETVKRKKYEVLQHRWIESESQNTSCFDVF